MIKYLEFIPLIIEFVMVIIRVAIGIYALKLFIKTIDKKNYTELELLRVIAILLSLILFFLCLSSNLDGRKTRGVFVYY